MATTASTLPWAWLIETLADYKNADTDLLRALITSAPDIMSDAYNNARERISLRYLEEWLNSNFDNSKTELAICPPSVPGSHVRVDVSELSEDVLMKVAAVSNLGIHGAELKHDLENFILHKRANLPAYALDQLKASIPENHNPPASSLRKASDQAREDGACNLDHNRSYVGSGNEDGTARSLKISTNVENIQSSKQSSAAELSETEVEILKSGKEVPQHAISEGGKMIKDDNAQLPKGSSTTQLSVPTSKDMHGLANENEAYSLDHSKRCTSNNNEDETAKRPKVSTNGNKTQLCKERSPLEFPENGNEILRSCEEATFQPNTFEKNSRCDDNDQLLKQSSIMQAPDNRGKLHEVAPPDGNPAIHQEPEQNVCADEAREGIVPETSSSDGGGDKEPNFDSNDEIVALEKQRFLSSSNQGSQNSLPFEWTEQSYCIKCEGGGQLLSCSGNGCPISVHGNCLGSFVSFGESGKFYCPFCSYTQAHVIYRKAKKKVVLARKALSVFMGKDLVDGFRGNDSPVRSSIKPSEARKKGAKSHSQVGANNCHKEITESMRMKEHVKCKNGNSSGREANTDPTPETHTALVTERHEVSPTKQTGEPKEIVGDGQAVRVVEHQQLAEPCPELEISRTDGSHGITPSKDGRGNVDMTDRSTSGIDHDMQAEAVIEGDMINKPNTGNTTLIGEKRSRVTRKNQLLPQDLSTSPKTKGDGSARNGNEEESSPSNAKKRRVQVKRYANPILPFARRNTLLWTPEEEEALKKGVHRFSGHCEKGLPWKKILESGSHVFHRTRTPVDLKDKWRNIMRSQRDRTK